MVKKLIKHEFIYYLRTLAIFLPVMLAMGLSTLIVQLFKNDTIWFTIIQIGSYTLLVFASFVCIFLTAILGIVRFYKNMYSSEGYLTFTLPVSNNQHIFAKLLTYVVCEVVSVIVVILTWLIALAPHLGILPVIFEDIVEFIRLMKAGQLILFIIEITILLLISVISNPLLYYACISVGQLAKKNRILLAIGAYYIYTVIVQILSTIGSAFFTLIITLGAFEGLIYFIEAHPMFAFHGFMWITIILSAALAFVFYLITIKIMNKKLNLE